MHSIEKAFKFKEIVNVNPFIKKKQVDIDLFNQFQNQKTKIHLAFTDCIDTPRLLKEMQELIRFTIEYLHNSVEKIDLHVIKQIYLFMKNTLQMFKK